MTYAYHFNKAYNALRLEKQMIVNDIRMNFGELIHTSLFYSFPFVLSGIVQPFEVKMMRYLYGQKMSMTMKSVYCRWEKHLHKTRSLILSCPFCSLHLCLSWTFSFFHHSRSQNQSPQVCIRLTPRSTNCHLSRSCPHHCLDPSPSCLQQYREEF